MLEIKTFVFGSFGTNMYVVSDDKQRAILIDPACSSPYEQQILLNYLNTNHLNVQTIVATHGHLDHLWGAPWACRYFNLPVLMHEADIPMAQHMQTQYDLWGIPATAELFPVEPLSESLRFHLSPFRIISTPGHTQGGICLYSEQDHALFSGDTLFRHGYGRTDLPGGDVHQLIQSLRKLLLLPPETHVYPGHGEPTTIGEEKY